MAKPGNTGLYRVIKAAGYSAKGLCSAWRHEAAFRQELVLMLVLTPLAFLLGQGITQQLLMLLVAWLVVIVEVLNSGIEAVVDRIGLEHHELSGRAKDLGSAAVFLSLGLTLVVWGTVIGSNLFHWW